MPHSKCKCILKTEIELKSYLTGNAPQQPLTLVAVGGGGGGPGREVVGRCGGDGVDERLQGFLVHVHFL